MVTQKRCAWTELSLISGRGMGGKKNPGRTIYEENMEVRLEVDEKTFSGDEFLLIRAWPVVVGFQGGAGGEGPELGHRPRDWGEATTSDWTQQSQGIMDGEARPRRLLEVQSVTNKVLKFVCDRVPEISSCRSEVLIPRMAGHPS